MTIPVALVETPLITKLPLVTVTPLLTFAPVLLSEVPKIVALPALLSSTDKPLTDSPTPVAFALPPLMLRLPPLVLKTLFVSVTVPSPPDCAAFITISNAPTFDVMATPLPIVIA